MEPTGAGPAASHWVLTDRDVRNLLDALEAANAADDKDVFYLDVLLGLHRLIPCDRLSFQLMDVREQRVRLLSVTDDGVWRGETVGAGDDAFLQVFWQEFWKYDGCAGPLLTNDYVSVQRRSDLWTERAYADTPLGSFFVNDLGYRSHVLVPMTPHGGTDRRLLLFRGAGPDFTERELMMLRLVRPHLAELHARRERELRGPPERPDVRRSDGHPPSSWLAVGRFPRGSLRSVSVPVDVSTCARTTCRGDRACDTKTCLPSELHAGNPIGLPADARQAWWAEEPSASTM